MVALFGPHGCLSGEIAAFPLMMETLRDVETPTSAISIRVSCERDSVATQHVFDSLVG